MLHTIIEKNSYHDSIVLMLLTNHLKEIAVVNNVQVMMGTPANKDIFKTGGLATPELDLSLIHILRRANCKGRGEPRSQHYV